MPSQVESISELLRLSDAGDRHSAERLFVLLYKELSVLAQQQLRRHGGGLTLGTSTLLHETYLRLSSREDVFFPDRQHFMAYAARAMRGLIVDYARRRCALKRGGEFALTSLPTDLGEASGDAAEVESLERLGEAMERLQEVDPELAQLVDLKYFVGLSLIEISELRGVTERTIHRHWQKARVFLFRELNGVEER